MPLKIWFGCRKKRYNIRFRSKVCIGKMDIEKPSEPDSTTLERDVQQEFKQDEDVLFKKKDGCFYLGTVVQVDVIYKKCLVEFMDNTKTWCSFKDLKSFAPQENEACYVCKKTQSENGNEIVVCKCGRACHQLCHQPKILYTTTEWICKLCAPVTKKIEEKPVLKKLSPVKKPVKFDIPPTSLTQLPYNLDSLTWDSKHHVNEERNYCYCGGDKSSNDMLQCKKCLQWFHTKCSSSVRRPMLRGDNFYEFFCSICNRGKEHYRRLEMKWPDLVHLLQYNLSLKQETKDKDIENIISSFINKHGDDIVLLPPVSRETLQDVLLKFFYKRDFVISEEDLKPLQNGDVNSSDVGCLTVETKKSEHKTVPPLVINVPKPYSTTLGNRDRDVSKKLKINNSTDLKVISSSEYLGRGLVKRSTPFPVSDQASNRDTRFRSHAVRKASRLLNKKMKRKKKKTDETSVLKTKIEVDQSPEDDEDDDEEEDNDNDEEEDEDDAEEEEEEDEEDYLVEKRKRKMQLRARVTNPEVRKRPQRNLLEARLNSTESKLYNPFTPVDTSKMKKPKNVTPEPKRIEVVKKQKPLKVKTDKIKKPKLVQKTIFDSFNLKPAKRKMDIIPVVRKYKVKDDQSSGDSKSNSVKSEKNRRRRHSIGSESFERNQIESDGADSTDDEASSRGTLEPFIPTPKDFEGQNNPFRTVSDLINTAAGVVTIATVPTITLPLPLKTVIPHTDPPRLKKRQLSEEDIIIDRNGQVKRRRRNRKNRLIEKALAMGTASKTAQIVPGKNNCVDYALNGRQLRTRESNKLQKEASSAKTTPVKQSPSKENVQVGEDLESSVKYFFGAAGRIANGEKYEVVAKRTTFDGRIQCIVEWKGVPT